MLSKFKSRNIHLLKVLVALIGAVLFAYLWAAYSPQPVFHFVYKYLPDSIVRSFLLNNGVHHTELANAMMSAFVAFFVLFITFIGEFFSFIQIQKEKKVKLKQKQKDHRKRRKEQRAAFVNELLFEVQQFTLTSYQALSPKSFYQSWNGKSKKDVLSHLGQEITLNSTVEINSSLTRSEYHSTSSLFIECLTATERLLRWFDIHRTKVLKYYPTIDLPQPVSILITLKGIRSIDKNLKGNSLVFNNYIVNGKKFGYPDALEQVIKDLYNSKESDASLADISRNVQYFYSGMRIAMSLSLEAKNKSEAKNEVLYRDYVKEYGRTIFQ